MANETVGYKHDYISLASEVVSAYVSNNSVRASDLPVLIASIHMAIAGLASGGASPPAGEPAVEKATTAQVRRSITPDVLISFIDGMSYKTLKRHLTKHGHTPESYRRAYGLPEDYPMVSASYREVRSSLAKGSGLGVPGGRATLDNRASKDRRKAA